MKSKKAKTAKKTEKKSSRKVIRKELETTIAAKFVDAIKGLGHSAENVADEIRKASKQLAKKLAESLSGAREAVSERLDAEKKIKMKSAPAAKKTKPVAKKDLNKAEKVVAKATKSVAGKVAEKKQAGIRISPTAVTSAAIDKIPGKGTGLTNAEARRKDIATKAERTSTKGKKSGDKSVEKSDDVQSINGHS